MATRRGVLADHKKRGKTLLAPFNHMIGSLQEVSWVRSIIPEILWIGLIQLQHGHRNGVHLITSMARLAREGRRSDADAPSEIFATASSFLKLSCPEWADLRKELASKGELFSIQEPLTPLITLYPECPLKPIFARPPTTVPDNALARMTNLVSSLFRRHDRDPMMIQATVTWLGFDAGKLKVSEGLALAQFPEIERYPDTELSRRVGSGVRATLNILIGSGHGQPVDVSWPKYFWNRELAIAPCDFSDD